MPLISEFFNYGNKVRGSILCLPSGLRKKYICLDKRKLKSILYRLPTHCTVSNELPRHRLGRRRKSEAFTTTNYEITASTATSRSWYEMSNMCSQPCVHFIHACSNLGNSLLYHGAQNWLLTGTVSSSLYSSYQAMTVVTKDVSGKSDKVATREIQDSGSPDASGSTASSIARNPSPVTFESKDVSELLDVRARKKPRLSNEQRISRMAGAISTILECIDDDPEREGLRKTPQRYAKVSSAELPELQISFVVQRGF